MPREEVLAEIDRLVEEFLETAKITQPPVDAIALAQQHLGMVVCLDKRETQRGRSQKSQGKKTIYLRPEPREERHQWTVAQAIGDHLKGEFLRRLESDFPGEKPAFGESLTNLFAQRLLVPTGWFRTDGPALEYDVLALKKRYHTASHEVLAWRQLDLSEPCIITVVDNGHVHKRRSNAWPIRKEMAAAESRCQEWVHERSEPREFREGGWFVRGWPVHELDWKREILRSVVEEGTVTNPKPSRVP